MSVHFDDAPRRSRGQDLPPRPDDAPDATEEWRVVVGSDGRYEVSSMGRVRSVDRKYCRSCDVVPRSHKGKTLTPHTNKWGYFGVRVRLNDRPHMTRLVHHLVAEAFLGPRPQGMIICHNDGNAKNNYVLNLRYDTVKANNEDTIRHGRAKTKLTADQVRQIRLKPASHSILARKYGVSISLISMIQSKHAWRHLE